MFNYYPFNAAPFNSPLEIDLPKTYSFLEAWRGLVESVSGFSPVTAYQRPQAAKNSDRVFYRLTSRDHLQGVTGYLGARVTYLDVISCSLHPSTAISIDLQIQGGLDRFSGINRGHKFLSVVHQNVTRSSFRNGTAWIWYVTSTYRVHHL